VLKYLREPRNSTHTLGKAQIAMIKAFTVITVLASALFAIFCYLVLTKPSPEPFYSVDLTPMGPPGPPINVTVTLSGTQSVVATVAWQAPANTGGTPITSYRVSSLPATTTVDVTAPSTTATISGLSIGVNYTFSVKATNAIGTSSAGTKSVIQTTAPDPPTNVAATASNASATVTWTAPINTGGTPITGYTITGGSSAVNTQSTSAAISGLANGTQYTFNVNARNSAGTSNPSTSVSVIPTAPPAPPPPAYSNTGNSLGCYPYNDWEADMPVRVGSGGSVAGCGAQASAGGYPYYGGDAGYCRFFTRMPARRSPCANGVNWQLYQT